MFFLPLMAWDSAVFFLPLSACDSEVFFLPLLAWDSEVFFLPPQDPLAAWDSRVFKLATVDAWIPSAARFCNRFISVARNCACRRRIVGGGTSVCSLINSATGKSMSVSKHCCNSCSQRFDMVRNKR